MAKAKKSSRSKDLERVKTVSSDQARSVRGGDKAVVHRVGGKSQLEYVRVVMKEVIITS